MEWRMIKNAVWTPKIKKYLHFDAPISHREALKLVKNKSKIKKHSFFPFLSVTVVTSKTEGKKKNFERKRKERIISYASHVDSHIYSYYNYLLSSLYESKVQEYKIHTNAIAFRKLDGKCNIHFAKDAFQEIKELSPCVALVFDVKGFFDNIDHATLKQAWCEVLSVDKLPEDHYAIFKSLTRYSYGNRDAIFKHCNITKNSKKNGLKRICDIKFFRNNLRKDFIIRHEESYGIPQGSPISGLLSNIYMMSFDKAIVRSAEKLNSKYYRYCDDILIICKGEHELFFFNMVHCLLAKLKLETNSKDQTVRFDCKNPIAKCDQSLQYLGFIFDGQQVCIRSSSHMRCLSRMRQAVSLAKQTQRKYNKVRLRKGLQTKAVYRKKLYSRYSYLGKRNYITYAHRAAKIFDERAIKRQVRPLWGYLRELIKQEDTKD